MKFEARKNKYGAWLIYFGDLAVKVIAEGRKAAQVEAEKLNAESFCVSLASMIESSGKVRKLWDLAGEAVIAAKSGENGQPSDLQAAGSLLWEHVKGLS